MRVLILLSYCLVILNSAELSKQSIYTKYEKAYLQHHHKITACIYTVLKQEAQTSNGADLGIGRDMIALFQEYIHIPIEIKSFTQLHELQKSAMNKECDMIPLMENIPSRQSYFNFTSPYFTLPLVMATKVGMPFINHFDFLEGKKIAAVKGHSYIKTIQKNYPLIDLIVVQSREEGLDMLRKKEVFGFLDFAQILNYMIAQKQMNDIAITAQFKENIELSVALRNDNNALLEIFNQTLQRIEAEKINQVLKKWYEIEYERQVDNKLFLQLLFFVVVIVAVFLYWHLHLKEDLAKEEKKQFLLMRQSKFAQMGEMIENIAHQWRQPLAQINSNIWVLSMILEKQKLSKKEAVFEQLQDIEDITNYMSSTIDDFRDFFHPEKSKETFSLKDAFDNSMLILKGSFKSHHIKIEFEIDRYLEVHTFLKELEHVIVIILNNAKEALIHNSIKNPLIKVCGFKKQEHIVIEISDNAKGIKAEHIEKIFDPYFTTKHKSQNTGLGLYMAKMIVEKTLEGVLSVQNRPNGACFCISIPKGEAIE
jgi:signal transduction histidine kinase